MARWIRFTDKDGYVVLANMDEMALVRVAEHSEALADGRSAFVICGKVIPGDIEALHHQLGGETFAAWA
jgi:hypothetical protein